MDFGFWTKNKSTDTLYTGMQMLSVDGMDFQMFEIGKAFCKTGQAILHVKGLRSELPFSTTIAHWKCNKVITI